jgi:hypothetical protein
VLPAPFTLASLAAPALAASYSVTVQTDRASYVGMAQIGISATVSPSPDPNTAVIAVGREIDHTSRVMLQEES